MPKPKRGDRPVPFSELVRAERDRPAADPQDARATNRVTGRDLWDDDGWHWSLESEISAAEAERLVADRTVKFGTSWAGERELTWFSPSARKVAWSSRFRPRLQSLADGIPADGEVGYVPQLWSRFDGSRLLLLQVIC